MGEWIEYAGPGEGRCQGYLATPAKGSAAPAVVVLQEWWGIRSAKSHIGGTCDELAAAGLRALAPDLYHGKSATDGDAAGALMKQLDFGAAVGEIGAAARHLTSTGSARVGVLGFCMGGALTIASALGVPGLGAAVCFYGIPPGVDAAKLRVPFLAHFATEDDWCNARAVTLLEQQLLAGNVDHTVHMYEAEHAFMNRKRPEVYKEPAARLAFDRSVEFLRERLG